jgi:hypothetical protein
LPRFCLCSHLLSLLQWSHRKGKLMKVEF